MTDYPYRKTAPETTPQLSRMLGHQSTKVTLDTYADLFDTDLDAVAAALDLKCAHTGADSRASGMKIAPDLHCRSGAHGGGGGI